MTGKDIESKKILTSGVIIIFGFLVNFVMSIAARILMARYLGSTGFGLISQGLAVMALSVFGLLGLDRGVSQMLPRASGSTEIKNIVYSAYKLGAPVSVALGGLVALLTPILSIELFKDSRMTSVLFIFASVIPLRVFVSISVGATRGLERSFPKIIIQNITLPVTKLFFIITVVIVGGSVDMIALAYPAAFIIATIISGYYILRMVGVPTNVAGTSKESYLFKFSVPIMIVAGSNTLFTNIDTLLLGFYKDSSIVGVYSGAFGIARLIEIVLISFSFISMPIVSRKLDENKDIGQVYSSTATMTLVASFPGMLSMLLFPELVLTVPYGGNFADGAVALQILAVAYLSHAVSGPNESTLVSIGRTRGIMFDSVAALFVNILVNFILIPKFGGVGAATGTALAFLLLNLLFLRRLYKVDSVDVYSPSFVRIVLLCMVLSVTVFILRLALQLPSHLEYGLLVPSSILVFLILIVRFNLANEEIRLLLRIVEDRTGVALQG